MATPSGQLPRARIIIFINKLERSLLCFRESRALVSMPAMTAVLSLTILEEFLLLALDDEEGEFYALPRSTLDCATAGAVAFVSANRD